MSACPMKCAPMSIFALTAKTPTLTPSEYVRALIRNDMERESERLYVFSELLKSAEDIKQGRTYSAEEVEARSKAFLDDLDKDRD